MLVGTVVITFDSLRLCELCANWPVERHREEGRGADVPNSLSDAGSAWAESVSELGYDDKGYIAALDEWYPEDAIYDKLGDEWFEYVMAEHRPE